MDHQEARRAFVDGQVRTNDVTDVALQKALLAVPREAYVPRTARDVAYAEADIALCEGRHLIEGRDFAKLVQALRIRPTDVILDVGCGYGYSSAVLAQMAETVIGLESHPDLAKRAEDNLADQGVVNAVVVRGPFEKGAAKHGPFDVILVNGTTPDVPASLFEQLAEGGRMGLFLGDATRARAFLVEKRGGAPSKRSLFEATPPVLPGFERKPAFVF